MGKLKNWYLENYGEDFFDLYELQRENCAFNQEEDPNENLSDQEMVASWSTNDNNPIPEFDDLPF